MYRKKIFATLVGILALGLASLTWAGIPDPDNSTAVTAATEDVSMVICPFCDGDSFDAAREFNVGPVHDATITVTLLDINGIQVQNYPKEDVWLTANGIFCCVDPFHCHADHDSDDNGQTHFVLPPCAGGCSDDFSTTIWVEGEPLTQGPLPHLMYNSPDMNGDLQVNLTDVVLFAQVFFGAYDYCADFFWDGVINLSDVVILAQHLFHECPN